MSRCFPYPPPGYLGIEGSGLALIESIKLRERDLVNAKAKKDRKREKKERKKQEKDKTIARRSLGLPLEPSTDVLQTKNEQVERSISGLKGGPVSKLLQSENEQLERSSLTQEHALHPCEEKPSTSSDSTQNSSKRKRDASSSLAAVVKQEENSIRGSGNVIRIRLSSKKQNALVSRPDPCSIAPTSEQTELPSQQHNDVISRQEPCSTSGRSQLAACDRYQDGQVGVPSIGLGNSRPPRPEAPRPEAPRPEADLACSPLVPRLVTREGNAAAAVCQYPENKLRALPRRPERESGSASAELKEINRVDDIVVRDPKTLNKKLVKAELRYRDLFSNWVPPPPQAEMELEDLDWLFDKKKNPDNQSEKKLKPSNNMPCSSSSSLWPRAQFIPEADIYALPYTVPF